MAHNHYMLYLKPLHSINTVHLLAFDEAKIIERALNQADRLLFEAIHSDENITKDTYPFTDVALSSKCV